MSGGESCPGEEVVDCGFVGAAGGADLRWVGREGAVSWLALEPAARRVGSAAGQPDDPVDPWPQRAATEGEQHDQELGDAHPDMAGVESTDAEWEQELQDPRGYLGLV